MWRYKTLCLYYRFYIRIIYMYSCEDGHHKPYQIPLVLRMKVVGRSKLNSQICCLKAQNCWDIQYIYIVLVNMQCCYLLPVEVKARYFLPMQMENTYAYFWDLQPLYTPGDCPHQKISNEIGPMFLP